MDLYLLKRRLRFFWQRRTRGWDDSETWSLDWSLANLILPRLERYREITCGHPADLTKKQWHKILDDIVFAFRYHADFEKHTAEYWKKHGKRVERGMQLFAEWYGALWW